MRWRPLAFLGTISYGIYLWHMSAIVWFDSIIENMSSRTGYLLLSAIVVGVSIPIATASLWIVERPMSRLLSPRTRRASRRVPGPAPALTTTPAERFAL